MRVGSRSVECEPGLAVQVEELLCTWHACNPHLVLEYPRLAPLSRDHSGIIRNPQHCPLVDPPPASQ